MTDDGQALIGIDMGTTSLRAIAFDARGRKLAVGSRPTPMDATDTGGTFDPDRIWVCVQEALTDVGTALAGRPVAGIAVSSIGESPVLIDEAGQSIAPSIVWFDRRTEPQAERLSETVGYDRIVGITGLTIHAIGTLPKLMWMTEHWPEAMARARHILMMGDWITYRLSGTAVTDPSLASRTLYFDIGQRAWSEELLAVAGVDRDRLPELAASGRPVGSLEPAVASATGIAGDPVVAVGGHDHVLGAFATGLDRLGTVVNSIGTAEAVLMATPETLTSPETGRRGYEQGAIETARPMSYLCASQFCSGRAMEWLRQMIGTPPQDELIAAATAEPVGSGGIVFLPHMINSPPPEPDPHARGAFVGLTPRATPAQLYRAVLEGLAMQSKASLDGMVSLPGAEPVREIRLIGGASRNRLLLAIKANVMGRPITVVDEPEATALGAALLGGVAAGLFPSLDAALTELDREEFVVEPDDTATRYDSLRTTVFADIHARMRPVNRRIDAFLGGNASG
ncbi:FGGY-family carbohydrate kinase [Bauldia sp.]|uniref:FGGY-family carbohydrate kinase n=1 Tax=Bauldia sp. TaxID=2575872 RepID=UPI003BADAB1A